MPIPHDRSFASHERAELWISERNHKTPRQVFKFSNDKYWFKCNLCNHEFDSALYSISNGNWCPYCANPPQRLCLEGNCGFCFDKSFASHERAEFWISERNHKTPRQVFKSSGNKYWFKCDKNKNHEFKSSLYSISGGTWCPYCVNKTEQILFEYLQPLFPSIIQQFKVDWCKNKRCLPFDFCIPDIKIIIELDGPQHFKQISNWQSHEDTLKTDNFKEQMAVENGYSVIRLLQTDVFYNTYDWKQRLQDTIQEIQSNSDTEINVYCLTNGSEYDCAATDSKESKSDVEDQEDQCLTIFGQQFRRS